MSEHAEQDEILILCISGYMGERRSQTVHIYTFRSCSLEDCKTVRLNGEPTSRRKTWRAASILHLYLRISLSITVLDALFYLEDANVQALCHSPDWNCLLCNFVQSTQFVLLWHLFDITTTKIEYKKKKKKPLTLGTKQETLYIITHESGGRGSFHALFLGRWNSLCVCLLRKCEELTSNLTSTGYKWTTKKNEFKMIFSSFLPIWDLPLILPYECQVWQLNRGQALNLNQPSSLLGCLQTRQSLMVLN